MQISDVLMRSYSRYAAGPRNDSPDVKLATVHLVSFRNNRKIHPVECLRQKLHGKNQKKKEKKRNEWEEEGERNGQVVDIAAG